jgi:hypothetical protein
MGNIKQKKSLLYVVFLKTKVVLTFSASPHLLQFENCRRLLRLKNMMKRVDLMGSLLF